MKDTFSGYHPMVNFIWFGLVLTFSMVFMHPLMLGISLVCSLGFALLLTDGKAIRTSVRYLLPLMIVTALLNPVFNHQGATILCWLPGGNPLTLEAILYGAAAAVMLVTVIQWFTCFNRVITSDKFVYLFGRIIPSLSLVLSMTMRFVPRFNTQMRLVANAQRGVGRDLSTGTVVQRAKHGLTILSIMITWVLESSMETADSMKSRGYGQPGRTAFSVYRFDRRDGGALVFSLLCGAYITAGSALGGLQWQYYPVVSGSAAVTSPLSISLFVVWLALCLMPVFLSVREDRKWKSLQSGV